MSDTGTALYSFELAAEEKEQLLQRFLRYVQVDTRSVDDSPTYPSSPGQWDLLRMLKGELQELGLSEVELDETYGYVFATLPGSVKGAPVVGFLSHVDTYPSTPGAGVKPQVVRRYDGKDLVLPGDPTQVITLENTPALADCKGHTLITSDGTTLLGADDKAGIAEIMTMLDWFVRHPELPHGTVRILFTPDEETGQGVRFLDPARYGCSCAYTVDGSLLGEIEAETFSGDACAVTVTGYDIHPGLAKGKMKNAVRAAADFITRLPLDRLPETTEAREPYLHPLAISGEVGKVVVKFILRAFNEEELVARGEDVRRVAAEAQAAWPGVTFQVEITPSYRNMKVVLDRHPKVLDLAMEAVRMAGVKPVEGYIRGGTDGSALSHKGIPTPNIFDGALNYHGYKECVSLEWMAKACESLRHLVYLWGKEKA